MTHESWSLPITKRLSVAFTTEEQELKINEDSRILNLCSLYFPSNVGNYALLYESSPNDSNDVRTLGAKFCVGNSTRNNPLNLTQSNITPEGKKLIELSQLNSVMASALPASQCGLMIHRLKGRLTLCINPHSFIDWSQQQKNKIFQLQITEWNLLRMADGQLQWVFF